MKFKILDIKEFGNGKVWLLAKLNLKEYVSSLTIENFNFEVQRKIVKNKYLDRVLSTIDRGEPLPVITLSFPFSIKRDEIREFYLLRHKDFDILDGLQRTYRLWAFWKIFLALNEHKTETTKEAVFLIKKKYPDFFEKGIVDTKFFKTYFPNGKSSINIADKYSKYDLYFTIWTNLDEKELVNKMLILNAGHKAVSTQHQFEILFLNLWKSLNKKLENIKIIREKDKEFTSVKRGKRDVGVYLFSSIITSTMSLILAKPQRISSDIIYKYDLMEEIDEAHPLSIIINTNFIISLLNKLKKLDKVIYEKYSEEGKAWFGKDTTLNGIFAGIGSYIKSSPNLAFNEKQILMMFDELIEKFPVNLQLAKFNKQYDNLTGRSVNIGNLIRTVIMNYTIHKLSDNDISWDKLFNQEMSRVW